MFSFSVFDTFWTVRAEIERKGANVIKKCKRMQARFKLTSTKRQAIFFYSILFILSQCWHYCNHKNYCFILMQFILIYFILKQTFKVHVTVHKNNIKMYKLLWYQTNLNICLFAYIGHDSRQVGALIKLKIPKKFLNFKFFFDKPETCCVNCHMRLSFSSFLCIL